ncbi:phage tail protein [Aeromonas jandaei]|uniref:phage tail-collar fiber domain-containing protein n=1 Tax=Aeromonas jandaei TaxID=650 RepID=UPI001ADDC0CF|nr:phage tail protein [Aeromonas jandaei]QTL95525.1 Tail fiber protein [Aeromonas jandaei]
MGQLITNAFVTYLRDCKAKAEPVVLDEIVLANIPNLDPDAPIDPSGGLPAASRIVHRHPVDQRGRINADAVAYSIVMDTTIGDFDFNAMYLINSALGIVGMVVTKGLERKIASNIATGKTGNSIVKSMVMSYRGAASATVTTVDASTWQIDYAARLRGMDEDMRLQALRAFGPASFQGDAFKMTLEGGAIRVQPGVAFVGGLRAKLDEVKTLYPQTAWTTLYLDVYRAGSVLDAWVNYFSLRMSQSHLTDYVDAQGYQHYVARVGHLNELGIITDQRQQRRLRVEGDAVGSAALDDGGDVIVTLQVLDDSHEHSISTVRGLQGALDSKAQLGHTHSPSESGAAPAVHGHQVADIWGLKADLDSKSNNGHGHAVTDVAGLQGALAGKADAGHTHSPSESGAAPAVHGHSVSDIWGLQTDLNGKSNVGHSHTFDEFAPQLGAQASNYPVGTYVFATFGEPFNSAALSPSQRVFAYAGEMHSGSLLSPRCAKDPSDLAWGFGSLPGTWRAMGNTYKQKLANGTYESSATLWFRVA